MEDIEQKKQNELNDELIVGLGWDPYVEPKKNYSKFRKFCRALIPNCLLTRLQNKKKINFDLDLIALLLNEEGKLISDQHVIFYNNYNNIYYSPIKLSPDSRTGGHSKKGYDEYISIHLPEINGKVHSIVFAAIIYKGIAQKQTFGIVKNAFMKIATNGDTKIDICQVDLSTEFPKNNAVEFGKLCRVNDNQWKFEQIGLGTNYGIAGLIDKYDNL